MKSWLKLLLVLSPSLLSRANFSNKGFYQDTTGRLSMQAVFIAQSIPFWEWADSFFQL
jgi:hypothetical protein